MENQHSGEASSSSNVSGEVSDSTVELNIKTLDSQIYSFQVDKHMPVSVFKEKIANEIGVPVSQQRLIFRGKVLKDEHRLSEYQVENGHTLHLVARQPSQSQPSADTSSGDTNGNNGIDAGAPRNRVGQISHSVVLGTFNVGDQGEGIVPDLSQVIGAVLNTFGISGQAATNGIGGMQASTLPNAAGQAPQGHETGGSRSSVGSQGQAGNQTQSGQAFPGQPFQSAPQIVQIPASVPVPSLYSPIPDSLNTLSEFMSRMERALAENGYQPNTSSTSTGDLPRVELPSNARGLPTLEALTIVLRHAERLLSGHTITALSQIAGRLEQEAASTDPTVRGQIQTESVQLGLAMQHLGALFLELGRTILTLQMGRSPAESSVNPGPAVYISPSGPNPIMVQPFPLQTNSLFRGSVAPSNPMTLGHVGIGTAPRHINIHIHAGTSLAPVVSNTGTRAGNGDRTQGELSGGTVSGPDLVHQLRNVIAAAVPSRSTGVTVSNAAHTGVVLSQPPSDSVSLSSVLDEINSHIRNLGGNRQGENQAASGSIGSVAGSDTVSNAAQPDLGVSISQSPSDSASLSSVVDEINSQLRYLAGSRQEENQPASGNDPGNEQLNRMVFNGVGESSVSLCGVMTESDGQKMQDECAQVCNSDAKQSLLSSKDASSSSAGCSSGETSIKSEDASANAQTSGEKHGLAGSAKAVPLGLGLGSLERKRRTREPKSLVRSGDTGTSNSPLNQNLSTRISGQQLLQSLASRSSGTNREAANDAPSGQIPPFAGQVMEGRPLGEQRSGGQFDAASAMSQVLHSPALNGLLAGVSEQTGVGSPNVFRNMLQQLSQDPQIMNTVSQIAQQVDNQDFGNMFSGLGSGQGGGIDLSNMIQQMMPVVSQVLGGGSATPLPFPTMESEPQPQHNERRSGGAEKPNEHNNIQIDLQEVAQRVEHFNAPGDVFTAVVENAIRLNGNGSSYEELLHELSNNEDLAGDYIEILQRDIQQRFQGDSVQDKR